MLLAYTQQSVCISSYLLYYGSFLFSTDRFIVRKSRRKGPCPTRHGTKCSGISLKIKHKRHTHALFNDRVHIKKCFLPGEHASLHNPDTVSGYQLHQLSWHILPSNTDSEHTLYSCSCNSPNNMRWPHMVNYM